MSQSLPEDADADTIFIAAQRIQRSPCLSTLNAADSPRHRQRVEIWQTTDTKVLLTIACRGVHPLPEIAPTPDRNKTARVRADLRS
jgi:hypothetical protein